MKVKGFTIALSVRPTYRRDKVTLDGFFYTRREALSVIKKAGYIWPAKVKPATIKVK